MTDFKFRLEQIIANHLPGEITHLEMSPLNRGLSSIALQQASNVKESAVVVLIFEVENRLQCTLIQRPIYAGSHSGQVSFPGGKRDPTDLDLVHTAMRECWEEIGVNLERDHLVGKLTPVYIPVSNFHVEPFVFFFPEIPRFEKDIREVEEVFTFYLDALMDDANVAFVEMQISSNFSLKEVPCFVLEQKQVWGATALILNELKAVLKLIF